MSSGTRNPAEFDQLGAEAVGAEAYEQPGALGDETGDGTIEGLADPQATFPSDGHEDVPHRVLRNPAPPVRHGAFAHHKGTAQEPFTIAYNGCAVSYRAHQDIDADDGLYDAIREADAPVIWK